MSGRPALLGAAVALLVATACSAGPDPSSGDVPVRQGPGDVAVERRDLTSVLTVDATVVAPPSFRVRAPRAGRLVRDRALRRGASVRAGAVLARVGGRPVVAPAAGAFEGWLATDGTTLAPNVPVASVRARGFAVRGSVPAELAYRIYAGPVTARAQVVGGPGPFDCALLDSGADTAAEGAAALAFTCAVPPRLTVVDGLGAVLALATATRRDVLALPVEAVAGDTRRGEVTVVDGGTPRTVVVELGASDGAYVEIVNGLDAGQRVSRSAPDLRARRAS